MIHLVGPGVTAAPCVLVLISRIEVVVPILGVFSIVSELRWCAILDFLFLICVIVLFKYILTREKKIKEMLKVPQ